MDYTLRFILGLFLVFLVCGEETRSSSYRRIRQSNDTLLGDATIKEEKIVDLKTKPKTESEVKEVILNNNKKVKASDNQKIKLQSSQPYSKEVLKKSDEEDVIITNNTTNNSKLASLEQNRKDGARSIDVDINKYVSPEFHNRNNVFTLPVSSDTEKYIEPDYSTHKEQHDNTKFDFTSPLTTPTSDIFDSRYEEAVQSVDQKLEHIDFHPSEQQHFQANEPSSNQSTIKVDYVRIKNIDQKEDEAKGSVQKDLTVEKATNLNFESKYNDTKVYDVRNLIPLEGDELKGESTEITTPKTSITLTTTRKSVTLTKPSLNKNNSYILNNKIETDTVKSAGFKDHVTITTTTEKAKGETELPRTSKSTFDITKRGSVKFLNSTSSTTPLPNTRQRKQEIVQRNLSNTKEPAVQENQIIPVVVDAPETTTELVLETTAAFIDNETETEKIAITSTTPKIVTTELPEITTTVLETTTEFTTEESTTTTTTTETATTEEEISTTEISVTESITDLPITTTEVPTIEPETTTIEQTETTTIFIEDLNTTTENAETTTQILSTTEVSTEESTTIMLLSENKTAPIILETTTDILPTTEHVEPVNNYSIPNTSTTSTTTEVVIVRIGDAQNNLTTVPPSDIINSSYNYPTHINDDKTPENRKIAEVSSTATTSTETDTTERLKDNDDSGDNKGTIAAIVISSVGAVCLILLAGLLYVMRKRQKRFNYGQRCRPVSLDDYSMDNISVYNSVSRKRNLRMSKRSYGNPAFEDPVAVTHPLNFPALVKFVKNVEDMKAEYDDIPQITARTNELPEGCETKNRYANVIPLPETRVFLQPIDGYPNSDYINANYVTGPKDVKGYYIACQGPMSNTVDDFWRMIWEQQSKVILMMTHLFENGIEKCVDYLPPSEVLDCHRLFGDFQVTLKKRDVKDKYIISSLQLKNMVSNSWREVTHFWYLGWPEKGIPSEANSLIAFLIEARSFMKASTLDRNIDAQTAIANGSNNNSIKEHNPVVVHCSPGTGRTGVVIACDIAIREFEQTRLVDVPKIVYRIRRDRASSVQTREQYEYIYKVVSLYATKLTGGALDSI